MRLIKCDGCGIETREDACGAALNVCVTWSEGGGGYAASKGVLGGDLCATCRKRLDVALGGLWAALFGAKEASDG